MVRYGNENFGKMDFQFSVLAVEFLMAKPRMRAATGNVDGARSPFRLAGGVHRSNNEHPRAGRANCTPPAYSSPQAHGHFRLHFQCASLKRATCARLPHAHIPHALLREQTDSC